MLKIPPISASQKSAFLDTTAKYGYALVLWWLTLTIMFFLDGKVELGSLAMVLVLSSALSGLLMPPIVSMATCAAAVATFNWYFVPPRGSFQVHLDQHLLMLFITLAVGAIVAGLMSRLRILATDEKMKRTIAEKAINSINEKRPI